MKIRPLYFDDAAIHSPGHGATSNTLWEMAMAMQDLGHEPTIAGYYKVTDYPYPIPVKRFNLPNIYHRNIATKFTAALSSGYRVNQMPDVDVVHLRDYMHVGVFARFFQDLPVVFTTPGNVFEREALGISHFDTVTKQVYKWSARASAKRATRVIAHSTEQRDWWLFTGTSPLKIHQIPMGVDQKRFYPIPDAKQQLGIDENTVVLFHAGRLYVELKGLDLLLTAFEKAHAVNPAMQLYIAGDGPEKDKQELNAMCREKGIQDKVHFLGWIKDELALYYNAADMFVLTSRSEPFSRVMLEAMACGTPFIGPPHGAMKDHIESGKNGYIVDPENTDTLSDLMLKIASDQAVAQRLASEGLRYIEENLTWKRIMQRVCDEVYVPIIKQHAKP